MHECLQPLYNTLFCCAQALRTVARVERQTLRAIQLQHVRIPHTQTTAGEEAIVGRSGRTVVPHEGPGQEMVVGRSGRRHQHDGQGRLI